MRAAAFLLCAFQVIAPPSHAEPPPFPQFTFKRVSAPQPGTRPASIVQIAPAPQVTAPDENRAHEAPRHALDAKDGFWADVSPELSAGSSARLADVLRASMQSGAAEPRLAQLQSIAHRFGGDILRATVGTRVSPALALAVIWTESAGDPQAVSQAGARGLMQLMPATAARFEVGDPFLPEDNIRGGVAYLDHLLDVFDRDPVLVLAAYNAGAGAVSSHDGVPPYSETRDYVPKALSAFRIAQGLCLTPPELITDGCVFAGLN